jgi:hypothetical protein
MEPRKNAASRSPTQTVAWVAGIALFVYGATGLLFGGSGFSSAFPDGTVTGEDWLGVTGNGWTMSCSSEPVSC